VSPQESFSFSFSSSSSRRVFSSGIFELPDDLDLREHASFVTSVMLARASSRTRTTTTTRTTIGATTHPS
jgi:hypothetical protein